MYIVSESIIILLTSVIYPLLLINMFMEVVYFMCIILFEHCEYVFGKFEGDADEIWGGEARRKAAYKLSVKIPRTSHLGSF